MISVRLNFPLGTFDSAAALKFAYDYITFPVWEISNYSHFPNGKRFDLTESLAILKGARTNFSIRTQEESADQSISSCNFMPYKNYQTDSFLFSLNSKEEVRYEHLMMHAGALGMSMGYITDLMKAFWQNQYSLANFKTFGKPHAHLRETSVPGLGRASNKLDRSVFYGRETPVKGMFISAAPKIWFGHGALEYFDANKILSFTSARKTLKLAPELIYIELFDPEVDDYEAPSILELQRKFREWTEMDRIENELYNQLAPEYRN